MVFNLLIELILSLLVLVGGLFCLIAAIGLIRLPDVYTRMHAASKAVMLGLLMPLTVALVVFADIESIIKAVLTIFFVVTTTPVAAHLIARAAYKEGAPACDLTKVDEYHPYSERPSAVQINLFKDGEI